MIRSFILDSYDSFEYPASVARAMYNKDLLNTYVSIFGTDTNIKHYVRWVRSVRNALFPGNYHKSKPSKFISIYGISRKDTVGDFILKANLC